ncbi:MAG: hypothetical protein JNM20_04965 [Rhizobiales bacterium]|nr:hypothetical protein [Hyphomicrobiales bacterium]
MPASDVLRLSAFGAVMEIACNSPEVLDACSSALPSYWKGVEGTPPDMRFAIEKLTGIPDEDARFLFLENGARLTAGITGAQASRLLASRMDYHMGAYARHCAFIHAGLVLHEGRAILLPGLSRAGKSTLTAALVRAGAKYVSDDVAVIGGDGRVHLLTHRMTLRQDMAGTLSPPAGEHQAALREGSAPVGAILVLTYQESAGPLAWYPLSAGETVLRPHKCGPMFPEARRMRRPLRASRSSCRQKTASQSCAASGSSSGIISTARSRPPATGKAAKAAVWYLSKSTGRLRYRRSTASPASASIWTIAGRRNSTPCRRQIAPSGQLY